MWVNLWIFQHCQRATNCRDVSKRVLGALRLCFDENLRKIQKSGDADITINRLVYDLVHDFQKISPVLHTSDFFDPISESGPVCSRFTRKNTHNIIGYTPVHTGVRSEEGGSKKKLHCPEKLFCGMSRSIFWSNSLISWSFETLKVAMSPQGTFRAQRAQN